MTVYCEHGWTLPTMVDWVSFINAKDPATKIGFCIDWCPKCTVAQPPAMDVHRQEGSAKNG